MPITTARRHSLTGVATQAGEVGGGAWDLFAYRRFEKCPLNSLASPRTNVGVWLPISSVVSSEEYLQNPAKSEPLFSLLEERSNPNAPYRSVFSGEKFFAGALGDEGFFPQLRATLVRWIRRLSPAV
jgi:hypothetical protein